MTETPLRVGVIGVGTMGQHHARVYRELFGASLVGVADADPGRAAEVADEYATEAMPPADLLEAVDAVSIAVPTEYHVEQVRAALEAGVHVLVEKPFVADPARGRELVDLARERDLALQVGHIERFNPVIRVLADIIDEYEVLAVDADRLGPPPDREIRDSAVIDLMIHDLDILLSLIGGEVSSVEATRAKDEPMVSALVGFDDGTFGSLTASRVTQQKVRELTITARECLISVDYIEQSIQIHRRSVPEYIVTDGDVRYRHESITERPTVSNGEPLKEELESFVEAVVTGTEPIVTGEDGLRAIELARSVEEAAAIPGRATPTIESD